MVFYHRFSTGGFTILLNLNQLIHDVILAVNSEHISSVFQGEKYIKDSTVPPIML